MGLVLNTKDAAPLVGKAVEGAVLGTYAFDSYQQEKDEFFAKEASLTILAHPDHQADAEARKARYAWVAENVNRARDLINEPGNVVTPETIAAEAGEIAREVELEIEVLDPAALRGEGLPRHPARRGGQRAPGPHGRAAPRARARPRRRRSPSSARASPSTPAASASSPATRCGR